MCVIRLQDLAHTEVRASNEMSCCECVTKYGVAKAASTATCHVIQGAAAAPLAGGAPAGR